MQTSLLFLQLVYITLHVVKQYQTSSALVKSSIDLLIQNQLRKSIEKKKAK